jgi:hypothetical protein
MTIIAAAAAKSAASTAPQPRLRTWLKHSLGFVDKLEGSVREEIAAGTTDLWELTQRADARLGPYPEFTTELGAGVHYVHENA